MSKSEFPILQATFEDVADILDLFVQCTDKLIAQGIEQWDYSYPVEKDISNDIQSKELYKLIIADRIAGVITINEQQDIQYADIVWRYHPIRIAVMHRLAVHPLFQGRGAGHQLVDFADFFARERGYGAIRLDAFLGNKQSNQLYKSHGYEQAEGICYFHAKKLPFNCWEKKII